MKIPRTCRLAPLALVFVVAATTFGQSPIQLKPQDGVLLLANGQVLSGKITQAGDYYFVETREGELRLKTSDVEIFCRDIDEGYRRKRAALNLGQADEHLDLAAWCLRHGLLGYAAREIGSADDIDPKNPRIALMERRLELARKPVEAAPVAAQVATISNDDLDRLVRGMPEGTVDQFTHTIQPLLLNNCTAAGCHGTSTTTKFGLLRIPLGRTPNRRLTQRNLHAVKQQIDQSNPANSPLLLKPILEHGPTKTPIFTNHDMAQYKQLVAWTHRVAKSQPAAPETVQRPDPLLQKMPVPQTAPTSIPPVPTPAAVALSEAGNSKTEKTETKNGEAKSADNYVPVDAFDPEIFNRRFSPPK
jgi:hypothetical protein